MKKNFLILCILLSNAVCSQNNLQFSKVISESFTLPTAGYGAGIQYSTLRTVPTGKVWKIESMGGTNSEEACGFEINGNRFPFYTQQFYSITKQNPIWLSAGTTFRFWNNNQYSSTSFYFSIIEFNVVQ
jgi:hypothetical protein